MNLGLTLVLCCAVTLAHAETLPSFMAPSIQEVPPPPARPVAYDADAEEHPMGRGTPGVAFLLGGAFQQTSHGLDAGPSLALRYYFSKRDSDTGGPESLSPWSVEVGAVLPHTPPGSQTDAPGGQIFHAKVRRFTSEHIALQRRWAIRRPFRFTPDLSLGVSFAQFENEFYTYVQQGTTLTKPQGTTRVSSIGPLIRLGLPLLANDAFALRMEVGYVHYANKFDAFGHPFDFGISGIGFYPSVQVGLGYLTPGIEKGAALPESAMPLWVIAALQTEKRSPIIAPPEVLLNPYQAAVQGGLSGNVLFQYKNRGAQKVELAGDFNQWKPEPMYMDKAHVWMTVKDLQAGTYCYVFIINGKREVRDPWNVSYDPSQRAHGVSSCVVPEVMPR